MNDNAIIGAPPSPLRIGMLVGSVTVSSGGVGEAVRALSIALDRQPRVSVEVFSFAEDGAVLDFEGLPVHFAPVVGPHAFGYAPRLVAAMRERDLDVLHVHGLWMYPSVAARRWARATERPYIVSPHGMLDPWALRNAAARKRLARRLYEDANLRDAACLHALCAEEKEAIRTAGFRTPTVVLPNGVDLPAGPSSRAPWRVSMAPGAKVLLFLGRVTPKKKAVELIDAFAGVHRRESEWHLVIVGPVDEGYRARIDAAVARASCRERIHVTGPAYGPDRASAYASADAFVLPSASEGLPMAALEAFACGLPALLTPQCNLPEAFERDAALRMEPFENAIADGLARLFAMSDDERAAMSGNARRLAAETFSWDTIARDMAGVYRRLARPQMQSGGLRRSLMARAGLPA